MSATWAWKAGGLADREVARARQVDRDLAHDPAGPRRDHHHLVGELDRLLDAVGDQEHGLAGLQPEALEVGAQLLAGHGVERTQGLVHQDQGRVVDQGAAEGGALLHAARELVGAAGGEGLEADRAQQLAGAVEIGRARQAAQVDLQQHVAQDVAPVDQDVALEDDADVGLRARRPAGRRGGSRRPCRPAARRSSGAACSCRSPRARAAPRTSRPRPRRSSGPKACTAAAPVAEGLGRTQDVDGDGHARLSSPAG